MGDEGEHQRGRIHDQEHGGDADGDGFDAELGRVGAARVNGGHEHTSRGDGHGGDARGCGLGREGELLVAQTPGEERGAEHEKQVADDRARDRRPHDLELAIGDEEDADDQLGGVAERGIQEAADPRPGVGRQLLGGVAE